MLSNSSKAVQAWFACGALVEAVSCWAFAQMTSAMAAPPLASTAGAAAMTVLALTSGMGSLAAAAAWWFERRGQVKASVTWGIASSVLPLPNLISAVGVWLSLRLSKAGVPRPVKP